MSVGVRERGSAGVQGEFDAGGPSGLPACSRVKRVR